MADHDCTQKDRLEYIQNILDKIDEKINKLFDRYDNVNEKQIRTDERVKLLERFVFGAFLTGLTSIVITFVARFLK